MTEKVFISIGSNLDPEKNIDKVKIHLNSHFEVTYSSIYKTPAEGFSGQDFLNLVCSFETNFDPLELRSFLKEIEKKMGRTPSQKGMSSRVIDLDLILYGNLIEKTDQLDIPSKDIEKYNFVLEPLCELAGDAIHPELKISYREIKDQII